MVAGRERGRAFAAASKALARRAFEASARCSVRRELEPLVQPQRGAASDATSAATRRWLIFDFAAVAARGTDDEGGARDAARKARRRVPPPQRKGMAAVRQAHEPVPPVVDSRDTRWSIVASMAETNLLPSS